MSEDSPRSVPNGLKAPGRRLWGAITSEYVLTPAEFALLEEACRTTDELDRLQKAIRALPELTSLGAAGQLRPHPFLGEARAHRRVLERLVGAMALPGLGEAVGLSPGQKHGLRAAEGRWGTKARGVGRGVAPGAG